MTRSGDGAAGGRRRPRGWALLDMTVGLSLCAIFTGIVVVASNHAGKARQRLAQQRSAVRLAESALLHAQAGAASPATDGGEVSLSPIDGDVPPPRGYTWVRAEAAFGDAEASLVGLVPKGGER